jgi:hypothetical protein
MAYEDAKHRLGQVETADQRRDEIRSALSLGMPLYKIELYLDWLDANQFVRNEALGQLGEGQSQGDQASLHNR